MQFIKFFSVLCLLVFFVLYSTEVSFVSSNALQTAAEQVKLFDIVLITCVNFLLMHKELCLKVQYGKCQCILRTKQCHVWCNITGHLLSTASILLDCNGQRLAHVILDLILWLSTLFKLLPLGIPECRIIDCDQQLGHSGAELTYNINYEGLSQS